MWQRIKNFEQDFSVSRAAVIVGFFALISKLVALFRDPLFASTFGGDKIYILDIYSAAFRVPDFIISVFVLGTLSVALIPIFVNLLVKDREEANKFANTIITLTMLFMGLVFFTLFLFARPITKLLVPGFSPFMLDETVKLTRLIIFSQIVFTLSNTCTNILYSFKRFVMAGLAPILYNLGIILGILVFYEQFGIMGLGYGVLVGAALHLLVQLPELYRTSFRLEITLAAKKVNIRKFLKLYLPRVPVFDLSIFSLLISTFIASKLEQGSIAIFNLAMNLQTIPVSIIALSLATAVFPALSQAHAEGKEKDFLRVLGKTIIQVFYFMVPIMCLMMLFRAQGIRLYLGHGNFTWENTILTFTTFGVLAFSLLSQSLAPILSRVFYSQQNTITPVRVNIFSMAINTVLAFALGKSYGIVGIAAAFSIASVFNATVLFFIMYNHVQKTISDQDAIKQFNSNIFSSVLKITTASLVCGLGAYGGLRFFAHIFNTHTSLGLFFQLSGATIFAVICYFIAGVALKLKETLFFFNKLKNIFAR